jgi:hypothetical protein
MDNNNKLPEGWGSTSGSNAPQGWGDPSKAGGFAKTPTTSDVTPDTADAQQESADDNSWLNQFKEGEAPIQSQANVDSMQSEPTIEISAEQIQQAETVSAPRKPKAGLIAVIVALVVLIPAGIFGGMYLFGGDGEGETDIPVVTSDDVTTTPEITAETTATEDITSEPIDESWREAYAEFLQNPDNYGGIYYERPGYSPYPKRFALHDIDNNGVFELIILNSAEGFDNCIIYTYINGNVEKIGEVGLRFGSIMLSDNPNFPGLFTTNGSSGYHDCYITMKNGEFELIQITDFDDNGFVINDVGDDLISEWKKFGSGDFLIMEPKEGTTFLESYEINNKNIHEVILEKDFVEEPTESEPDINDVIVDFLMQFPTIFDGDLPNGVYYRDYRNAVNYYETGYYYESGGKVAEGDYLWVVTCDNTGADAYAREFTLYDFDGDGIPEILVTYFGYTDGMFGTVNGLLFKFVDGEYKNVLVDDGGERANRWFECGFGSWYRTYYLSADGGLIIETDLSDFDWISVEDIEEYISVVFDGSTAIFRPTTNQGNITPIEPLATLQAEIDANVRRRLG